MRISMIENWVNVELGKVCDIISGKNQKDVLTSNGKFPIYGSGGIFGKANSYLCEAGSTIIGRKGTINKPIFVNERFWNVDTAFGISPSTLVNKKYIYFFCLGFNFKKLDRSTTIPSLAKTDIAKISLPLAPLPIQRAIVAKIETLFSDLDNGIANLKQAQAQLKIYRQAVLEQGLTGVFTKNFRTENPNLEKSKDLFQKIQDEIEFSYKNACIMAKRDGKRKPKDQRTNKKAINVTSYLPEIPWNYYRLEDLTYLVTDGTHFTPKYQDQGIKFLSVKNVRPYLIKDDDIKYISEDEHYKLTDRCKPEYGDILYTKVGATYGYAAKVKLDYEFSIFVSLCLIKPVHRFLLTEYLEYLMNSEIVFRQARQRVSGSGVPDLHLVEIRDFKIPLPSVEEQHVIIQEIESRLSVCDKMVQSINESLAKAEALRQSILKKAFEGNLLSHSEIEQCKTADDYEPASALLAKIKAEKEKAQRLASQQKKSTAKKKSK